VRQFYERFFRYLSFFFVYRAQEAAAEDLTERRPNQLKRRPSQEKRRPNQGQRRRNPKERSK
jgi:hypothetical protein